MRQPTTRHGRTGEPRLDRQVGLGDLATVYGVVLFVPVLLWTVANPVLAGGLVVLAGGAYATARIGTRIVGESAGGEASETGSANGWPAD